MKYSELTVAMDVTFGHRHGQALMRDLVLPVLASRTPAEAVAAGEDPQLVWDAVCAEMRVPEDARFPHRQDRRRPASRGR